MGSRVTIGDRIARTPARVALLALLALAGVTGNATPFRASRVPASASGVIHVNMEGLRSSVLYRLAMERTNNAAEWLAHVEPELRPLALLVLRKATGITLWILGRPHKAQNRGAAVIEMPSGRELAALLHKNAHPKRTTADHSVYELAGSSPRVFVAQLNNVFVVSTDEKTIETALGLRDRATRALSSRTVGSAATDNRTLLFGVVRGALLDMIKEQASSMPLQSNIRSLSATVREHRQQLQARIVVGLDNAESAHQSKTMVAGLLSLASLGVNRADAARIIEQVMLTVHGTTLQAQVGVPSNLVLDWIGL